MIAHKFQYKDRQLPETIRVIPADTEHLEQIQALAGAAYHIAPADVAEWFTTDEYASRIAHFPEGQFIAQETATGRVVGMTSSMRFNHDPEITFIEDWDRTTGYG